MNANTEQMPKRPKTKQVTLRPAIGPRAGETIKVDYPVKYDDLSQLKRNAEALRKVEAERLDLMREARANGASYREIADAVGMSHTAVAKWLKARST